MATMKMPCAVGSGGSTEEDITLTVARSGITWTPISCKKINGFCEVYGTINIGSQVLMNQAFLSGAPVPAQLTEQSTYAELGSLRWTNGDTGKTLGVNSSGEVFLTSGGSSNPVSGLRLYLCYKIAE